MQCEDFATRRYGRPIGLPERGEPCRLHRSADWLACVNNRGSDTPRAAQALCDMQDFAVRTKVRAASLGSRAPIAMPADSLSPTFAAVPAPSRRVAHARFKAR